MINNNISYYLTLTFRARALRGELHSFWGTGLRCNSLEWNDHSALLRLALHPKNRTLHPVQLPDLGLTAEAVSVKPPFTVKIQFFVYKEALHG